MRLCLRSACLAACSVVLPSILAGCGGPPSAPLAGKLEPTKADAVTASHGAFAVVFAGPRGEVSDRDEPAVTVLFNRAMRDPDKSDAEGLPAMKLEGVGPGAPPTVAGSWRWVGTHGILFTPDHTLPGSTSFRVTVPAGTRSLDGEALTADYSFDLATPVPRIVDSVPKEGPTPVRTNESFRVRFNQPMAPEVVAPAAHFRVAARTGEPSQIIAARAAHPASGKSREETLVITPVTPLPVDRSFDLVFDAGLHGAGGRTTAGPHALSFSTFGPLEITSFMCPRSTGPRCDPHRNFTVVLSNPVDPDDFRAHLRIPDLKFIPPAKTAHGVKRPSPPVSVLVVAADPEAGKRYHLTLTKGLKDIFGQKLEKDLAFDIDTVAPWVANGKALAGDEPPRATPSSEDNPSGEPSTTYEPGVIASAPHRARLDYRIDLGVRGHVVEALAKTGLKSHRVPIGAVNIPTYGLYDRKVSPDDALAYLEHASTVAPDGQYFHWDWITPNAPENTWDVRTVDLDALLGGPNARGAALLAIDLPGQSAMQTSLLSVTDLALSADVSRYGSLVWVTHLSTGLPVSGATVSVRGVDKQDLYTVTTDADGLATFPAGDWIERSETRRRGQVGSGTPYFFVRSGDDWTYSTLTRARADYGSGVDLDVKAKAEWAGMLYADRGVYRPGETMKVAGVFRKVEPAGVTIVPAQEARVLVEDATGEKVFDGRAKLGAFGELAVDVLLPKTAHLGSATIKVELGRKDTQSFGSSVLLAAYKASEFKVDVSADHPSYVRGDAAEFDVHAEYLYGSPMSGERYQPSALRHATSFAPTGSEAFVTNDDLFQADQPDTNADAEELSVKAGDLDANGHASVPLTLALAHMRGPEEVVFESEVTDLSHETVAKRATVRVDPAEFYLGIGNFPSRFVSIGADVPVKVVAFQPKGAHVPGVHAKVSLIARSWTSATVDEAADVARRTSKLHDEVLATCDVTTTADVAACKLHVGQAGYFLVRTEAQDARGNVAAATTSLYSLADRSDAAVSWAPPGSSRRLKLEADKKVYEPGDVARILVQNPFKKAEALVTVERGGVMDQQVVALEGTMPVVSVKVKPEYFPNAYVSVRLLRGRVAEAPAQGADVGGPDFRLGLLPIAVDPATHRLTPTVTTNKKDYAPGETVDADVVVKGRDGRPGSAEVTFYAVDEGVLLLTSYETPDPLPAFSVDRKLAVYAVETREELALLKPLKNGERIRPLGYDYLNPQGGDKGNDGGGGGGAEGARLDFKTTAFFDAGKTTDGEGRVHYQFKLPDNLTTFRLMAIVAGADDRFGAGDAQIVTSKHLMARPILPRIVRVGDAFNAGVIVSSKDFPATTARVTVTAQGVQVSGPVTRDVAVPKGGSVEVRFPFLATAAGTATFGFAVEGSGAKDRVSVTRPVTLPLSVETVSTYGETSSPAAVALGDLTKLRSDEGGLDVHLASTALVGLGSSIDELVQYPYGCTEQLTSRLLPLLVLPELAKAVGAHLPAKIPDAVDEGIGKLLEHQNDDGGFSFWGDGPSEPWLSAYAMLAVERAARQGLFVPKQARDQGVAYLRQQLDQVVPAQDDDAKPKEVDPDEVVLPARGGVTPEQRREWIYADLAFVADTLASIGEVDAGSLSRLFEARAKRPLFTQALLVHAMALAHLPVSQLDTVLGEILQRVRVDADDAYADEVANGFENYLDSSTRTSSLVLRALLAAHPDHPLASKLARGLLRRREGGGWRSTQENVWALLALDDYRRAQESVPPAFDARVFLGATRIGEAHFHGGSSNDQGFTVPMATVFPESGRPLTFDVSGEGKLFYSADLRTASAVLPTRARDSGMYVQKLMRGLDASQLADAQKVLPQHGALTAKPGNLVLIDVLLETAEPREQVVIDDPLPAGLEPIDFLLDSSAQNEKIKEDGPITDAKKGGSQYGAAFRTPTSKHREQHDDKVLTFLGHLEPGIYHFRYLARATTPGDFVVPPTRAACMYSPEVWGTSPATRFAVTDAPPPAPPVSVAKNP